MANKSAAPVPIADNPQVSQAAPAASAGAVESCILVGKQSEDNPKHIIGELFDKDGNKLAENTEYYGSPLKIVVENGVIEADNDGNVYIGFDLPAGSPLSKERTNKQGNVIHVPSWARGKDDEINVEVVGFELGSPSAVFAEATGAVIEFSSEATEALKAEIGTATKKTPVKQTRAKTTRAKTQAASAEVGKVEQNDVPARVPSESDRVYPSRVYDVDLIIVAGGYKYENGKVKDLTDISVYAVPKGMVPFTGDEASNNALASCEGYPAGPVCRIKLDDQALQGNPKHTIADYFNYMYLDENTCKIPLASNSNMFQRLCPYVTGVKVGEGFDALGIDKRLVGLASGRLEMNDRGDFSLVGGLGSPSEELFPREDGKTSKEIGDKVFESFCLYAIPQSFAEAMNEAGQYTDNYDYSALVCEPKSDHQNNGRDATNVISGFNPHTFMAQHQAVAYQSGAEQVVAEQQKSDEGLEI